MGGMGGMGGDMPTTLHNVAANELNNASNATQAAATR